MRTLVKKHSRVNAPRVKQHVRETANMLRSLPKARDIGEHFGKRGQKMGTLIGKPLLKGAMTAGIGLIPAMVRGHKQSMLGHAWDQRREEQRMPHTKDRVFSGHAQTTADVKKRIAILRKSNSHSPFHFLAKGAHAVLRGPRKAKEWLTRGSRQRMLKNGTYHKVHEKEAWEHHNHFDFDDD